MERRFNAYHIDMHELLNLCLRIDEGAEAGYREMAASCPNTDLAAFLTRMAADEHGHQTWWHQLRDAYEAGRLPEMAVESEDVLERMRAIADDLESGFFDTVDCTDLDAILETAARLEFFMFDPVFTELIELTEKTGSSRHLSAYSAHIERLAGAIESFYSRDSLAVLLAGVLRRSWRDFARSANLSRYDQLTHALNRRGLIASLDQWATWAARYGRPLSVVTVDLDHFKDVNDTHGHAAGDLALIVVTNALRETLRESDLIGRQGGDEFTIIAPETDGESLERLLARVTEEVPARAQREWPYQASVPLSLSAGGAWTAGEAGITGEELLSAADAAMYRAKDAGRARAASPVNVTRAPAEGQPESS